LVTEAKKALLCLYRGLRIVGPQMLAELSLLRVLLAG
jgi:hypothetical protein